MNYSQRNLNGDRQMPCDQFIRVLSLGILCFQGFGLRVFEGIMPMAILFWAAILFLLNVKSILKIPFISWIKFSLIIFSYYVFCLVKDITPTHFLIIAWLSAFFVLSNYRNDKDKFVLDVHKLTLFCMYYSLLHIPIAIVFKSELITTNLGMHPKTFLYLFWFNKEESIGGLNRIQGFCWEPSCWIFLLNLNLLFSLYFKKTKDILLSVTSILFAMSTTGNVVMIIILILYYFLFSKGKMKLYSFLGGLFSLVVITSFTYTELQDKLETGSGNARMGDIGIAMAVLNESPVLGADLQNITANLLAMRVRDKFWEVSGDYEGYMNQGMVNSFASLFVEWGLIISFIIFYLMFNSPLIINRKLRFLFMITFFSVLIGTPISQTGFFYMFVFSKILYNRKSKRFNLYSHV